MAALWVNARLKSRALYSFHHPTIPSADSPHITISTCRCHVTRWRNLVKKNTAQATATSPAMIGNHAIKAFARSAPVPPPAMVASKASGRQLVTVKVNAASAYAQPKLRPNKEGDDDGWFMGDRYWMESSLSAVARLRWLKVGTLNRHEAVGCMPLCSKAT